MSPRARKKGVGTRLRFSGNLWHETLHPQLTHCSHCITAEGERIGAFDQCSHRDRRCTKVHSRAKISKKTKNTFDDLPLALANPTMRRLAGLRLSLSTFICDPSRVCCSSCVVFILILFNRPLVEPSDDARSFDFVLRGVCGM